jgi:serine/threonine protein kinase
MTIKCQTCAYENPNTEKYCLQCGDTLKIISAISNTVQVSNTAASTNPVKAPTKTVNNKPTNLPQTPVPATVRKSATVKCGACGVDNDENEAFCFVCNGRLSKTLQGATIELPPDTILEHIDGLTNQVYRIQTHIGQGGFAITYRAIIENSNQVVVIKELFPENAARDKCKVKWSSQNTKQEVAKYISDFKSEAEILSKFSHPSIVRYHSCFEANNTCYIVMGFVRGKSMQKLIEERKKLDESTIVKYIIQIAEAVQEIHNLGFLHRDIKPDNIMIDTQQDRAVLIDFGAARKFEQNKTKLHTIVYTPGYAPIEQYNDNLKRTFSSDIYSLCASIYHAVVGEPPIDAKVRTKARNNGLSDPLLTPSQRGISISSNLEEIISIGMDLGLKNRFFDIAHLLSYLKGQPIDRDLIEARYFAANQQQDEAIAKYKSFLNKSNSTHDQIHYEARIELAQHLLQRNAIKEAQKYIEEAIKFKPSDRQANGILGVIYSQQENWQEATSFLKLAIANQINQDKWQDQQIVFGIHYALSLGKTGNWSEAQTVIEAIAKLSQVPQNFTQVSQNPEYAAHVWGIQAWIELNQGKCEKAIPFSIRAVNASQKLPPSNNLKTLQTWILTCQAIAIAKNPQMGINHPQMEPCFKTFEALIGNDSLRQSFSGWQLLETKQNDLALRSLENIVNYQTDAPYWIQFNLAVLYEEQQDIPKAIQAYEKCLSINQNDPNLFFRLGVLFVKQKRWLDALDKLQKANNLKPDFAKALHQQGAVLLKIIQDGIPVQGKDTNKLNQEMVETYTKAEQIYRIQEPPTADKLKSNLPFLT